MNWTLELRDAVVASLTAIGTQIGRFIPGFVAALAILAIGYLVSRIAQKIASAVLQKLGLDRASERSGLATAFTQARLNTTPSQLLGKLVFWILMLTFLISGAEALGLESVSQTIDTLVSYLPNVLAAGIIIVLGILLAHFVRDFVRTGLLGLRVEFADTLSKFVYGFLIVVVASTAFGQLRLETDLINRAIEILLLVAGGALALALGLGTRDLAKNIVAGTYARDIHGPGSRVTVGTTSGTLREVGRVCARIETDEGSTVYVPNGQLLDSTVTTDGAK